MATEFFEDFMEDSTPWAEQVNVHTGEVVSPSRAVVAQEEESRDLAFLKQFEGNEEALFAAIEMRSSYIDEDSEELKKHVGKEIVVHGCWIQKRPAGHKKENDEEFDAYDKLYLKVSDFKHPEEHIILWYTGKRALYDALNIWVPLWGMGDWKKGSVRMKINPTQTNEIKIRVLGPKK